MCGEKVNANDARPLRLLTARVAENLRRWLRSREELPRRARAIDTSKSIMLAQAPQQLVLLQRYQSRIERQIERKLALLRH